MTQQVLHHPRLAWDAARVIVRALESDHLYAWLSEQYGLLAGASGQRAMLDSWNRLWFTDRLDAPQAEAGLWRARLEDLLRANPESAEPLRQFARDTAARIAER